MPLPEGSPRAGGDPPPPRAGGPVTGLLAGMAGGLAQDATAIKRRAAAINRSGKELRSMRSASRFRTRFILA